MTLQRKFLTGASQTAATAFASSLSVLLRDGGVIERSTSP